MMPGSTERRCPVWRHARDAAWVDSGDRVTALDLSSPDARPQALEGVAAVIWRALADPQSLEALLTRLAADFPDVAPEVLRADVDGFLARLAEVRLATSKD